MASLQKQRMYPTHLREDDRGFAGRVAATVCRVRDP